MPEKSTIEQVCIMAGKMMLESGAETYRVEDTMDRIAKAYGVENPQSYASLTEINFSTGLTDKNSFIRITKRETNLHKVDDLNRISRQIADGKLRPEQAIQEFEQIEEHSIAFPIWIQLAASGLASGSFAVMFGGTPPDFLPALLAGMIGYAAMIALSLLFEVRFLSEFFASFLLAIAAYVFIRYGVGNEMDKVIIGAVMPLVPGLHITNAIRDLMLGHLIAGLSKGIETVLTSCAIGAGVAMLFAFV